MSTGPPVGGTGESRGQVASANVRYVLHSAVREPACLYPLWGLVQARLSAPEVVNNQPAEDSPSSDDEGLAHDPFEELTEKHSDLGKNAPPTAFSTRFQPQFSASGFQLLCPQWSRCSCGCWTGWACARPPGPVLRGSGTCCAPWFLNRRTTRCSLTSRKTGRLHARAGGDHTHLCDQGRSFVRRQALGQGHWLLLFPGRRCTRGSIRCQGGHHRPAQGLPELSRSRPGPQRWSYKELSAMMEEVLADTSYYHSGLTPTNHSPVSLSSSSSSSSSSAGATFLGSGDGRYRGALH